MTCLSPGGKSPANLRTCVAGVETFHPLLLIGMTGGARHMRIALASALAAFVFAPSASAKEWFVNWGQGSDFIPGYDGTAERPYKSLGRALTMVGKGDTVWIDGPYGGYPIPTSAVPNGYDVNTFDFAVIPTQIFLRCRDANVHLWGHLTLAQNGQTDGTEVFDCRLASGWGGNGEYLFDAGPANNVKFHNVNFDMQWGSRAFRGRGNNYSFDHSKFVNGGNGVRLEGGSGHVFTQNTFYRCGDCIVNSGQIAQYKFNVIDGVRYPVYHQDGGAFVPYAANYNFFYSAQATTGGLYDVISSFPPRFWSPGDNRFDVDPASPVIGGVIDANGIAQTPGCCGVATSFWGTDTNAAGNFSKWKAWTGSTWVTIPQGTYNSPNGWFQDPAGVSPLVLNNQGYVVLAANTIDAILRSPPIPRGGPNERLRSIRVDRGVDYNYPAGYRADVDGDATTPSHEFAVRVPASCDDASFADAPGNATQGAFYPVYGDQMLAHNPAVNGSLPGACWQIELHLSRVLP
jgi:hypothetical protein